MSPPSRRQASTFAVWVASLVLAAGCATPIGVDPADPREVQREIAGSAVTGSEPSAKTRELLTRLGLRERFGSDPDGVLAELHGSLGDHDGDDVDRLYALAELSFVRAGKTGRRDQALAAAVYAYAFLFGRSPEESLEPFDPRVAVARNLYNMGLAQALTQDDGTVAIEGGVHTIPFGSLTVSVDESEKVFGGRALTSFRPATAVQVRGLANRHRHSGLGAPLSAARGDAIGELAPGSERVARRMWVPVTAVLFVDDVRARLADGNLEGRIEIFTKDEHDRLEIRGRAIPLERETSSALALSLEGAPIWDFGFAGFRLGDFMTSGQDEQLLFLDPHRPGRIPLVLVHGTFSSPATWAQVVNELANDPRISERYEIWLFLYNTGNPIAYSSGILRRSLAEAVNEIDPEGKDPALRRMVVVGHSQGGLLTKTTAVRSGDVFWKRISEKPIDEVDLDPELRSLLRQSLYYEPLPFVERVVFMSTPHGGSFLSDFAPAAWIARLVKMPISVTRAVAGVAMQSDASDAERSLARPPTSLDNMRAGNPYLESLRALPIDPRIRAHSIIPVLGDGPLEDENDGVVRYPSAHLEGVESEKVVRRSDHSVQDRAEGIQELRRILVEHLGTGP